MISTRGRYAIRVMMALAERRVEGYTPMKEVAQSEGISLKYLEQIMPVLTKNGFVQAAHGKGGGYILARKPEEYRIGDILRITEGTLASVACLADGAPECERSAKCRTLSFWKGLDKAVNEYVDSVTLADLIK